MLAKPLAWLESRHVVYEWGASLRKETIAVILVSRTMFADIARHDKETMAKDRDRQSSLAAEAHSTSRHGLAAGDG
jgi:hypothetical protein